MEEETKKTVEITVTKRKGLKKSIVLVAIIVLFGGLVLVIPKNEDGTKVLSEEEEMSMDESTEGEQANDEMMQDDSSTDNLKIEDLVVGDGEEAKSGKVVTVDYVGTLEDGTQFDSSIDRGTPFRFDLGAGEVIQGWDLGVQGMKVGGKRKLTIPPELAYGERGIGDIPPNSTLIFEVELLKVE